MLKRFRKKRNIKKKKLMSNNAEKVSYKVVEIVGNKRDNIL